MQGRQRAEGRRQQADREAAQEEPHVRCKLLVGVWHRRSGRDRYQEGDVLGRGRVRVHPVSEESIDVLLQEGRTFPPPPRFTEQAVAAIPASTRRPSATRTVLAATDARARRLVRGADGRARVAPAALHLVSRRRAERRARLPRPARRGRPRRPVAYHFVPEPLGEPPRAITYADLLDDVCRMANALREHGHRQGRHRRDLHGDGAGAAGRDAGLRPDRRAARGRVRRLLGGLARRAARERPARGS